MLHALCPMLISPDTRHLTPVTLGFGFKAKSWPYSKVAVGYLAKSILDLKPLKDITY